MISKNISRGSFLTAILFSSSTNLIAQDDYDGFVFKNQVSSVTTITEYSSDSLVFNRDNKVTEVWIKENEMASEWDLSRTLSYDEYGNKAEYRTFYHGTPFEYYIFKYDEKNNLVERIHFLQGDILDETRVYIYNEKNKILSEEYYQNGEPVIDIRYTYNENGLLFKYENSRVSCEYYYDSYGRIIEEMEHSTDFNGKPQYYNRINKYNDYGRLVEELTKNAKGKVLNTMTYTYDNAGICTSYTFTSKKKITHFAIICEYDVNGNWIKQTIVVDGTNHQTFKREITYF